MDFEKQKPVSDQYRENWERVFKSPKTYRTWLLTKDGMESIEMPLHPLDLYTFSEESGK